MVDFLGGGHAGIKVSSVKTMQDPLVVSAHLSLAVRFEPRRVRDRGARSKTVADDRRKHPNQHPIHSDAELWNSRGTVVFGVWRLGCVVPLLLLGSAVWCRSFRCAALLW